jgi:hypothetical protein
MASPTQAIINGSPDGNNHPYVCLIVFDDANGPAWRCTGSLIAPNVVLTARHCSEGVVAARIWITPSVQGNPDYPNSGDTSYDASAIYTITNYGYCAML